MDDRTYLLWQIVEHPDVVIADKYMDFHSIIAVSYTHLRWAEYKISVHHLLWPVPASAINANTKGVINQNIGYPGAEKNVEPLKVGQL